MNPTQSRILAIGILFAFVFLTGFVLSRSGKPYNGILLNLHKLTALAGTVLFMVALYWLNREAPLQPSVGILAVFAALSFIALMATGGLISIIGVGGLAAMPLPARTIIFVSHRILPYLAVISSAASLCITLVRTA